MSRRTPRSRSARRGVVVAGCTIALVALAAGALSTTTASWTDRTHFAAEANAGTWGGGPGPGEPAGLGGISPGNDATALDLRWQVQSPVQFCVDVPVTTASPTPVEWAVRVDTAQIPFNGRTPSQIQSAAVTHGPDADGVMFLGGTAETWNDNRTISANSSPVNVRICVWGDRANPPAILAAGSDTYTFTTALAPGASAGYACTVTTITGHTPTFYVGFEVTVDWRTVLDDVLAQGAITADVHAALAGRTLTTWHGGSGSWQATTAGDVVTVRGSDPWNTMGITAGQVIELRGCTS